LDQAIKQSPQGISYDTLSMPLWWRSVATVKKFLSSVSKWVSLCWLMKSSDELVEQAAGGTSVAQIFEESDEEGFRKAEVCPDLALQTCSI
jgi:hypothetical protein